MWAALGAALGRVPGLACVKQPRAPAPGSPFSHSKAPCMSERTVHGAQSREQTMWQSMPEHRVRIRLG